MRKLTVINFFALLILLSLFFMTACIFKDGEKIGFDLSFETNGGSEIDDIFFEIDSDTTEIDFPDEPTKDGYIFDGWYLDNEFEIEVTLENIWNDINNNPSLAKTFYAKWEINTYNISYNLDGGDITGEVTSYTVEDDEIILAEPTKDGFDFAGWYNNSNFDGEEITAISKGSFGDLVLFAKWEEVVLPIGNLQYPNSYPTFSDGAVTFAPTDTHSWAGAIEGGIEGDALVIEKAIYLFLLASYNEIDLPYYAYYLPGTGGTDMGSLNGTMLSQSYHVVNNTIGDNKLVYHRLINHVVDFHPQSLLGIMRMTLNEAYQRVYYNDTEYNILAAQNSIGITSETDDEEIVLGANWNYNSLVEKEYDGLIDDWEDIDTTGMTQDEIAFAYRYKSKIIVDLLAPYMVESATLEYITDGEHGYWEGSIIVDVEIANNDETTIANLKKATGDMGNSFNKFELSFQIWDIGVFKYWSTEESWNGKILTLSGYSTSQAPCYYSYNIKDCDLTDLFAEFDLEVPTE